MTTSIDLLDPPAVISSGGLVDPSTATGQVDEESDWCGAVAALLTASVALERYEGRIRRSGEPAGRMAHIIGRRGAYSLRKPPVI